MAQVSSIADEQTSTPLSSSKSITLRIARYNPAHDDSSIFMEFTVPYEKWTTVLDAILEVKKHFDHSVAVRYSCRQASCGSCGMMINGKPKLACFTKIIELNSNVVTVEPTNNFPIIRDLAVKFERLFDSHHKILTNILEAIVFPLQDQRLLDILDYKNQQSGISIYHEIRQLS